MKKGQKYKFWIKPNLYWLFAAAALLIVTLVRALELRLPGMVALTGEGETRYNLVVNEAKQLKDLMGLISYQCQPVLDVFIRKVFWSPLLGYHERSWRIPSLFYSLTAVILVFYIGYHYFRKLALAPNISLFMGFLVALWLAHSASQGTLAWDGRHYSFVALISIIWFTAYLRQPQFKFGRFFIMSLIFANAHFFALAMIGSAYGLGALEALWRKDAGRMGKQVASLAGIYALTKWFNWGALHYLSSGPPVHFPLVQAIESGWDTWVFCQDQFNFPLPWVVVWAGLFYGIRKRGDQQRIFVFNFITLPLFFFYFRLRSDLTFGTRYCAAFEGVALYGVIFFLRSLYALVTGLKHTLWKIQKPVIFAVIASICFHLPSTAMEIIPDLKKFPRLSPDFTPWYRIFDEIKDLEVPIFLINSICYLEVFPLIYLRYNRTPYYYGHEVIDSFGCAMPMAKGLARLDRFLETNPKGAVIFDQHEDLCEQRSIKYRPGVTIQRTKSAPHCVWIAKGIRTRKEVREIGELLKFPMGETFR